VFVAQGQMLMTFVVALTAGAVFVYAQETILDERQDRRGLATVPLRRYSYSTGACGGR
jgi:hypothetical protein